MNKMQNQKLTVFLLSLGAAAFSSSAHAQLTNWTGATNAVWNGSTPGNWDNGVPVSGSSSVAISAAGNVFMQPVFTIASGESLTASGATTLRIDSSSTHLTVATGGTFDFSSTGAEFTNQRSDGGRLTIEAGSTVSGFRYYSQNIGTTEFVANAAGVELFDLEDFRFSGGNLEVDLTNYNTANGLTIGLFTFANSNDTVSAFNSVTVTGIAGASWAEGVDYTINYNLINGGDIGITIVPEPSSFALISGCFALGALMIRRRRASLL